MEDREPTEAQAAVRERFRQAALYGKLVMADPQAKQVYEAVAKAKGQPLFSLTVADFFNAPSVDAVDLAGYSGRVGDPIVIMAHDDFQVNAVNVALTSLTGNPIESGEAVENPPKGGRRIYTATATVPAGSQVRLLVTASDRPGGTGSSEVQKSLDA